MYTKFFRLTKRPFLLTADPEFLYLSSVHDLAMAHLEYGIRHHAGFVALTGEVGAGKTTLLKHLLRQVETGLDLAMIFNTLLDPLELLEMLAREFGLTLSSSGKAALVDILYQYFMQQFGRGRRCCIIIDEAQNLSLEAFEELRMLSNLEAGSEVLVQIILVGQPQLRQRLAHPSMLQLTQRIAVHYHLGALSRDEVGQYLSHRLRVAGYEGPGPLFSADAVARLAELSRGIPRVINSICDAALTYAFADKTSQVTLEIVAQVVADNELLLPGPAATHHEPTLFPPSLHDPQAPEPRGDIAKTFPTALSHLQTWIETFQRRLEALEAQRERDAAVTVLQELLKEERKRTVRCARMLSAMKSEHQKVHVRLAQVRDELKEAKQLEKPVKPWRISSHD